jgi:hypothetical protein
VNWLYLGYFGLIPVTWWATNRTRAFIGRCRDNHKYKQHLKWRKEVKANNFYRAMEHPAKAVWCPKCDGIYEQRMMAWDLDGDEYLCAYCNGVPKLIAVLRIWYKWYWRVEIGDENRFGENRGDDLAGWWPSLGGPPDVERRFDDTGLTMDTDAVTYSAAVQKMRGHGIAATNATNAAYERRIAERARKRKADKETEAGHWEWTGMGREWIDA